MMRLAAAILVTVLATLPLTVFPSLPVTWFAVPSLLVGGAGVVTLSVPLVTAGASLALIAYALALVIARPAVDPVTAVVFGATLVTLLALIHFAEHTHGAELGRSVITSLVRQWLATVAAGVLIAVALIAGGAALGSVLQGATLPLVVVAAALGAVVTMAGAIKLVTTSESDDDNGGSRSEMSSGRRGDTLWHR